MIKSEIALFYFKQVNSSWQTCWKLEKETQMANTKQKWKLASGRWYTYFPACLPNYTLRETNMDGTRVAQGLTQIHGVNELCSVREIRTSADKVINMKTTVCLVWIFFFNQYHWEMSMFEHYWKRLNHKHYRSDPIRSPLIVDKPQSRAFLLST